MNLNLVNNLQRKGETMSKEYTSKDIKESAIQTGQKTSELTQRFFKSAQKAYSGFKEEFKEDKNKE